MDEKTGSNRNHIMIESRKQKLVTCPYCWTDQRTERDFCYRCGAEFIYRDEQEQIYLNKKECYFSSEGALNVIE